MKDMDNSVWCTVLSCFADTKTFTWRKKLTASWPWACNPQPSWSLSIDDGKPCDTTLLPHHQHRIVHELITDPAALSLTLSLKTLHWNSSGSLGLLSMSHPHSFLGSCNKPCTFLHHNLMSVDWHCCALVSWPKLGSVTTRMPRPRKCG